MAYSLRAEVAPSMLTSGNGKTLDMFAEFYAVHSTRDHAVPETPVFSQPSSSACKHRIGGLGKIRYETCTAQFA